MEMTNAVKSGLAGAFALNAVHESARHFLPNAPRVELMAMKAVDKFILRPLDIRLSERNLYLVTMLGDVVSNSIYYAGIVGLSSDSRKAWRNALLFGAGAGALTVALPPVAKLGQQPTRNFPVTAALTVGWYTLGALVAAGVWQLASKGSQDRGDRYSESDFVLH